MADINHQIHLVSRPSGEASAANFRLVGRARDEVDLAVDVCHGNSFSRTR